MRKQIRIGVDTGGTFTDFIFWIDGKIHIKKFSSTPANPSLAILQGLSGYLNEKGSLQIIHGSTVAANALLQRSGGENRPPDDPGVRRCAEYRPAGKAAALPVER